MDSLVTLGYGYLVQVTLVACCAVDATNEPRSRSTGKPAPGHGCPAVRAAIATPRQGKGEG